MLRVRPAPLPVHKGTLGQGVILQDHVVRDGQRGGQAHAQPVLGDEGHGDALFQDGLGGQAHDVVPLVDHQAGLDRPQTGDGLAQLLLAAARDASHAQDLAAADIEVHVVDGHGTLVAADGQVPYLQQGAGLLHQGAVDVQVDLPAHHPLGQLLLAGLGGVHGGDILALAQDGHPVRQLHHLVQLVGDDDDGVPLVPHPAQDGEQLFDLLHRQHGGGLVQDDDLGPVIQHLDDLQGLLFRHGHVVDLLLGVQLKAELAHHVLDLAIAVLLQAKARLFFAHPDVVRRGEHVHQLEVLVDHADAQLFGVLRGVDGHGLALHQDLPRVWLIDAGEHVHQRGLARAVLPQQGQYLPLAQVQVDVMVGRHAAKGLGDAPHLNGIGSLRHKKFLLCPGKARLAGLLPLFSPVRAGNLRPQQQRPTWVGKKSGPAGYPAGPGFGSLIVREGGR